jgi:hypothetical protein
MASEQGREYNPETAMDLRPRKFSFDAFGEVFQFTLQIPEYVLARLDSEVMGRLYEYMQKYAENVVIEAMRGGYLTTDSGRKTMSRDVATHLKNYIWERFSISQEKAGHECWEVAPSMQEVRL